MGTKKIHVYFSEIKSNNIKRYLEIMRQTTKFENPRDNFLEIEEQKFYCRVTTGEQQDLVKFYKLRGDFNPLALKDNGEDFELQLPEGSFTEVTYFLIYQETMAILKTPYSPNLAYFQRYIQILYETKINKEFPTDLTIEFIDLYDKEVLNRIKEHGLYKFNINIKILDFNAPITDEIDYFFKEPLERALKDQVVSLTIGMRKDDSSFGTSIKNALFKLVPYATVAKATTLENHRKIEYNLLKHRVKYSETVAGSIHSQHEVILHKAIDWLLLKRD